MVITKLRSCPHFNKTVSQVLCYKNKKEFHSTPFEVNPDKRTKLITQVTFLFLFACYNSLAPED